ncbi:MAG: DegT/DnrJ/EryC1/StrS family aminotransferase [Prevotella sp.]|nr:DegT/DnrJ/EryC1/StrS family aminotransferase [Prevotella sp.]
MIEYLPLKRITAMHADEIHEAVDRVVDSGWYLRGKATECFEEEYARYIGTKHCVGVANGLDALTLILRAYIYNNVLKEGDEVIVPANTYIATILSITANRLKPVLVEPRLDTFQIDDSLIEQAITERTRAIMLVHLYGRCAYTERIATVCQAHNLLLIEDNAQAHGSVCDAVSPHRKTGSLGHAAAHSFYPGKNLGALGDGGAVTTNDSRLAETVRAIANYGSSRKYVFDYVGRNSRLDELQAAVLSVKLKYLDQDNERRRQIASRYLAEISNPLVTLPTPCNSNVYHIFPLLCPEREALQQYLKDNGVGTMIHYPIPPHRQQCYSQWSKLSLPITETIHEQELSIPCNQAMTGEEVAEVIALINDFRK